MASKAPEWMAKASAGLAKEKEKPKGKKKKPRMTIRPIEGGKYFMENIPEGQESPDMTKTEHSANDLSELHKHLDMTYGEESEPKAEEKKESPKQEMAEKMAEKKPVKPAQMMK
jgi:hypothetical protein